MYRGPEALAEQWSCPPLRPCHKASASCVWGAGDSHPSITSTAGEGLDPGMGQDAAPGDSGWGNVGTLG